MRTGAWGSLPASAALVDDDRKSARTISKGSAAQMKHKDRVVTRVPHLTAQATRYRPVPFEASLMSATRAELR